MPLVKAIEEYVRSLGLDAYLVGGAVRDELLGLDSKDADFLVPGVDSESLRAALAPHGRVEELVVAGRAVGMRLFPRDAGCARSRPRGSSSRRRARERSRPAPAATTSRSSSTRRASVEDDLAPARLHDQRDGAPALETASSSTRSAAGEDLERPPSCGRSSAEKLRARIRSGSCAALRFVSQLGFDPDHDDARADARGGTVRRARLRRADRRRARRRRDG